MICPLCHNKDSLTLQEKIPLNQLIAQYQKKYQANLKPLFAKQNKLELLKCKNCSILFYSPLISGDEDFYNTLQIQPWYYVDEKPEFKRAIQLIPPNAKVLETGSGKGNFARFLQNVEYTGLDFSSKAQQLAAQNGVNIIRQSVQEHSIQNPEHYDVACSFQVLEHVEEIHSFLEAQIKCLKPGGTLIIGVPSEDSYIAKSFDLILNMPPHHLSRWSDECLKNCASLFNLELIGIWHDELQPHHYFDYSYTITLSAIRKALGIPYKSLDSGLIHKLLKIPAFLIGKLVAKGLEPGHLPHGHTVVAAFRKPA